MNLPAAHRQPFEASFFVLRTPLQPRDVFCRWSSGLAAFRALQHDDEERLALALESDLTILRARLRQWVGAPLVREAIFIASRTLTEGIERWLTDPNSPRGRDVEYPLLRYLTRMTTRATPFGIFSGISVGTVGAVTDISLGPLNAGLRHARVDAGMLSAIGENLARDREILEALPFRLNPALHLHAGTLRFVSQTQHKHGTEHAAQVLPANDYLLTALERARDMATMQEIARSVCSAHPEITPEDAREFAGALASHQLIVTDLEPVATGPEAVSEMIRQLSRVPGAVDPAKRLAQINSNLSTLNRAPLGVAVSRYTEICDLLSPIVPDWARSFDHIQVDLYKPPDKAVLGEKVIEEILAGVDALHRLQSLITTPCTEFAAKFQQRYGEREIPLLEALDEEVGIGFGRRGRAAAYGDQLPWNAASPNTAGVDSFGTRERWLLTKLAEALQSESRELRITDADLQLFPETEVPRLPDAFYVNVVLDAKRPSDIATGDFKVVLLAAAGPSGVRLLGRFCHLDPQLLEAVRTHLRAEEAHQPDAVYAEIVNVPHARHGNFAHRPLLREYEIPVAGRSGAPADRQLPLRDLRVSVRNGRIALRSERLGREVIPRLSTAQSPFKTTSIHRFLFALQDHGTSGNFSWDWGPLASAPYLPRVVHGRAVLAAARWSLSPEEQRDLKRLRIDSDRMRACARLRDKRGLPRIVRFNNALLVDFENIMSINAMIAILKEHPVVLCENVPDFDANAVSGPEGSFEHEIVVPFVRRATASPSRPAFEPTPDPSVRRSFAPGSDWLFAKLYVNATTADNLLRDEVMPLVSRLRSEGLIEGWFFIRYGDPDWHLRLRFRGPATLLNSRALPLLNEVCELCLADGRIWRVQFDTYERELRRYGGSDGIVLAERLFEIDSDTVLEQLATLSGGNSDEERFHLTVAGVDRLLDDFGIALDQRQALVKTWRDEFLGGNRSTREFLIGSGEMFRAGGRALERLFATLISPAGTPQTAPLVRRSMRLATVVGALQESARNGTLTKAVPDLIRSYAHMHVNRMLRAATAPEECLVYDFLVRMYESRLARARNKNGGPSAN